MPIVNRPADLWLSKYVIATCCTGLWLENRFRFKGCQMHNLQISWGLAAEVFHVRLGGKIGSFGRCFFSSQNGAKLRCRDVSALGL